MKLDNIIYDVNSLALAIAEQWNNESETFKAMYPSDTATALINVFAGYGAMLQYMLLGAVANCYTTTAFSKAAYSRTNRKRRYICEKFFALKMNII